jgi:two-component system NarL family response regulator
MKIRIVLVDEHTLLRVGLRMLLAAQPDLEVVGEAADGPSAIDVVEKLHPQVVLSALDTPGLSGAELTRRIHARNPEVRVIGVSVHASERRALEMLDAGAKGYVHKTANHEEIVRAIREVARGRTYICPRLAAAVARARSRGGKLGRREREIVRLLAAGRRSSEIAAELGISENTVETHRRNILRKLGLHGIAELTRYAIREGLAPADV